MWSRDRGGAGIAPIDCETTELLMLSGFDTLITEERSKSKSYIIQPFDPTDCY